MSDSRVALITGASSGIGEAAAIACMKAGIHVAGDIAQTGEPGIARENHGKSDW